MLEYRSASLINFVVELPGQLETNSRYMNVPDAVVGRDHGMPETSSDTPINAGSQYY